MTQNWTQSCMAKIEFKLRQNCGLQWYWLLYDGLTLKKLMAETIESVINISNQSTTSQCFHQHKHSPTSVTNIDLAQIKLSHVSKNTLESRIHRRINDGEWWFSYSDPIRVKSNGILTQVQNAIDWQQDSAA